MIIINITIITLLDIILSITRQSASAFASTNTQATVSLILSPRVHPPVQVSYHHRHNHQHNNYLWSSSSWATSCTASPSCARRTSEPPMGPRPDLLDPSQGRWSFIIIIGLRHWYHCIIWKQKNNATIKAPILPARTLLPKPANGGPPAGNPAYTGLILNN